MPSWLAPVPAPFATVPVITVSPVPPIVSPRAVALTSLVMFTAPKVSFLPLAMVFPMARLLPVLPVTVVARRQARSLASDPEFTKNTVSSDAGQVSTRRSANSIAPACR